MSKINYLLSAMFFLLCVVAMPAHAYPYQPCSNDLWAGYSVNHHQNNVSFANGTWVVQTVQSTVHNQYSTTWVGISGDNGVISQCGTESDTGDGSGLYFAWYEFYPADPVYLNSNIYDVHPGDSFKVEIEHQTKYHLIRQTMFDITQGWSYTAYNVDTGFRFDEAEWILEDPCELPFAKLTTTTFKNCSTTVNGANNNILYWATHGIEVDQNTCVNELGHTLAVPGNCTDGKTFNVVWKRAS